MYTARVLFKHHKRADGKKEAVQWLSILVHALFLELATAGFLFAKHSTGWVFRYMILGLILCIGLYWAWEARKLVGRLLTFFNGWHVLAAAFLLVPTYLFAKNTPSGFSKELWQLECWALWVVAAVALYSLHRLSTNLRRPRWWTSLGEWLEPRQARQRRLYAAWGKRVRDYGLRLEEIYYELLLEVVVVCLFVLLTAVTLSGGWRYCIAYLAAFVFVTVASYFRPRKEK